MSINMTNIFIKAYMSNRMHKIGRTYKRLGHIICFSYNKKNYYITIYTRSKKIKIL